MKKVLLLSQWQRQLDNTKSNHIVLTQFSLSFSRFLACHNSQAFSTLFMWHLLFSFSRHCRRFRCHLFVHYMDKKKLLAKCNEYSNSWCCDFCFGLLVLFEYYKRTLLAFCKQWWLKYFKNNATQLEKQKEIIGAEWRDTTGQVVFIRCSTFNNNLQKKVLNTSTFSMF